MIQCDLPLSYLAAYAHLNRMTHDSGRISALQQATDHLHPKPKS